MKYLVDESVEFGVVLFLRKKGYDVLSVAEEFPSGKDCAILAEAFRQNRILITNDKDFGELIFRNKLAHKGVILLRLFKETAKEKSKKLQVLLKQYTDKLEGNFVVVTDLKIRIRKTK